MGKYYWLFFILCFQVKAENIVDPTKPINDDINQSSTNDDSKNDQQVLTAIFIKQGLKQAVINNHLYKKGDYFNGNKIISIKKNKVILKKDFKESELLLIQPIKKRITQKK